MRYAPLYVYINAEPVCAERKVLSIWDLNSLLTLLLRAATKWMYIGLGLHFSKFVLDIIGCKFRCAYDGPLASLEDMLS